MAVNELLLEILGAKFTITVEEDEAYLKEVFSQYCTAVGNTQDISGIKDPLNAAILTGFLLCDEINKMRRRTQEAMTRMEGEGQEAEERTNKLIAKLDHILKQPAAAASPPVCFKLHNQIKHYEWGAVDLIPAFLGLENRGGLPWAEMWMGGHPGAPSMIEKNGNMVNLNGLIAENPEYYLGKTGLEKYGELPFLFKLLAADKPLSIQTHPNMAQAREGFERENKAGLSPDDPKRNYKDPNHKPEIICAIEPITLMCGFRQPAGIYSFFESFLLEIPANEALKDAFSPLLKALRHDNGGPAHGVFAQEALKKFFCALFDLTETQKKDICGFILETCRAKNVFDKTISQEQWGIMSRFAALYPGDISVLSPLYLNLFTLQPGQALFVDAGIPHAYLSGFGVELMANSDNVLRGGLTHKHADIPELINVLDFRPYTPQILQEPSLYTFFRYYAPCEEFSLSLVCGAGGREAPVSDFAGEGPAICIVTDGELVISGDSFKKGEAVFIPAGAKDKVSFTGDYRLYMAAFGGA